MKAIVQIHRRRTTYQREPHTFPADGTFGEHRTFDQRGFVRVTVLVVDNAVDARLGYSLQRGIDFLSHVLISPGNKAILRRGFPSGGKTESCAKGVVQFGDSRYSRV